MKHPSAYVQRLRGGHSPAVGREVLDPDTRRVEDVLLRVRLAEGLPVTGLDPSQIDQVVGEGLAQRRGDGPDTRLVLTRPGRLLADAVVRRLLG